MGFVVWLAGGVIAAIVARIIPFRPKPAIRGDVLVSAFAAVGAGVLATALDFGGWNEGDIRAAAFAGLVAFAALGIRRMKDEG